MHLHNKFEEGGSVGQFEYTVETLIEDTALFKSNDRLLVACSGGVDSMALLYFLLEYKQKLAFELAVAHVDHMLRGEDSAGDRAFVEAFCKQHRIPCFSAAIPIGDIVEAGGGNLQTVCRNERYRFFEKTMQSENFTYLVTAHHADDQLETMLMNLTKFPASSGLQGIQIKRPFANGFVIRPFLSVTKEEISSYLLSKKGTFREDSSNAKDSYMRNRFRHHVLPFLKAENPKVAQHAYEISRQLYEDEQLLMMLAEQSFLNIVKKTADNDYELEINALLKEPVALQKRLLLILLNYIYLDTNIAQSSTLGLSILKFIQSQHGSAMLNLPNGIIAKREYGKLMFQKNELYEQVKPIELLPHKWTECEGYRVYIGDASAYTSTQSELDIVHYVHPTAVQFPLHIRSRLEGDRIHLKGMTMSKRLSRLFIDEKVPLSKRHCWPVLVNAQDEVLAVLGIRVSNLFSRTRRSDDEYVFVVRRVE